jgi:DNA-binding beta-propeller fold protein YncE
MRFWFLPLAAGVILGASAASAQTQPAESGPYKVLTIKTVGGLGGWDYVYADSDGRRLFIPRTGRPSGRVTVFDLDTLNPVGEIHDTNAVHGVAVDPKSAHGFCSSNPIVMFDSKSLATIKTIPVQGSPDGILFDPATEQVFVLSHRDPNVTVLNAADGSVAGTIDLGGAPEQAATDGNGHVYIDIEDGNNVAAVDAKTRTVTAHYDISGQGGGPGGLAIDAQNHILFAFCHDPAVAVILNADNGKVITSLPIGSGVDSGEFNPNTGEAFSSQRDGTLTVIKEQSPASFSVEQTVRTRAGARTSTLDSKTNRIYLITADMLPPSTQPAAGAVGGPTTQPQGGRGGYGGGRGRMVPGSFKILVVGQ